MRLGPRAHLDFESGSDQPLGRGRSVGVHRYVESPITRIWHFCWWLEGGFPQVWRPGDPDPQPLLDHIAVGGIVVAHNAAFERLIWNHVLTVRYKPHWPKLMTGQLRCTMARASSYGLPASLETLGEVLGTAQQKDAEGSAAMERMAKPRRTTADGTVLWWDDEVTWSRSVLYCVQDVRTEHEIDTLLDELSDYEQEVWELDQTINDRGVAVDIEFVRKACALADIAKKRLDAEMRRLTRGAVSGTGKVQQIIKWLNGRGIATATLQKSDLDDLILFADISGDRDAKAVIELRRNGSKTSVGKYKKMLECVNGDGRIRGLLAYAGARTRRWAGRLVQPQNMPRFNSDRPEDVEAVEDLINRCKADLPIAQIHDAFAAKRGFVMPWLSKALRSTFIAPPGRKFLGGDFSNIEGRINAWLSGEEWKLAAFTEYDAGVGPDLYVVTAAQILGKKPIEADKKLKEHPEHVTNAERQSHGKIPELACGYQGAVGAFLSMAAVYDVDLFELARVVHRITPAAECDSMAKKFDKATDKFGLRDVEWAAIKLVVRGWRAKHPGTVQSWWDLQDAAIEAVSNPGRVVPVLNNRVFYMCHNRNLYCQLPSGGVMVYVNAYVKTEKVVRVKLDGTEYERTERRVCFWGVDSETKRWCVQYLYGGLQIENIVQAAARDIMVEAMFNVERAGYPIILTVHDELLCEIDERWGNTDHFAALMSKVPGWAAGLPMAVKAWEDRRYIK